MPRVRFAPRPTGTLHVGDALSAVANRAFGDWMLLRIDDTDPARNAGGGEEAIIGDLGWIDVAWDEGPVRRSERRERHLEAADTLGARFDRTTLVREDGAPTEQLAGVVDDADFGITHVIRGNDHRANEPIQRRLAEALGAQPPEYVHHGVLLGPDGRKPSRRARAEGATVASLRDAGIPAEAVRAYLDELGLPRHDVRLDLRRLRRLAIEAIATLSDEELAARAGAPVELVPALRGARDLVEARASAQAILNPEPVELSPEARPTLQRFAELRSRGPEPLDAAEARAIVRELKAVGGDLRALRLALTGQPRGPELWAVLVAVPRDEALARLLLDQR